MTVKTCKEEGCGKPKFARGWCQMHYGRWYTRGTTEVNAPPGWVPEPAWDSSIPLVEEWRPIREHPGYEVSSFGEVRSLDRRDSRGRFCKGQTLRPGQTKRGHFIVVLGRASGTLKVAYLVMEAFGTPKPFDSALLLHWDDDPRNNRLDNLRWGSYSDNAQDKLRNQTARHHGPS